MECHTKDVQAAVPIDTTRLFQGNREFQAVEFGLPPGFPAIIFSRNLTPTANGIQGWTAQAVADAIRLGVDKDGVPICPPMPAGPGQAFGGITPSDALDIGHYLTTLPPVDNGVIPNCTPPRPDASTDWTRLFHLTGATARALASRNRRLDGRASRRPRVRLLRGADSAPQRNSRARRGRVPRVPPRKRSERVRDQRWVGTQLIVTTVSAPAQTVT